MSSRFLLELQIADMESYRDEAVCDIVIAHEKKDDEGVKKWYHEYQVYDRMVKLGYEMLLEGKLEVYDLKWAANEGWLCDMDWEEDWLKNQLEKAGVNKEEYDKKWKAVSNGKTPVPKTGSL